MKDSPKLEEAKAALPPPKQFIPWRKAMFWHSIGFVMIVMVLWADELFNATYHLFGGKWQEADIVDLTAKSGVMILLWMFSAYKMYQILSRLSYLESFLHICAWCRKIEKEQQWLTLEQHFTQQTRGEGKASHGICPECAKKLEDEYAQAKP